MKVLTFMKGKGEQLSSRFSFWIFTEVQPIGFVYGLYLGMEIEK